MKKLLCMLFAFLLASAGLASCGKKNHVPAGTAEVPETDTGETADVDENGYLRDSLPALDFEARELRVLSWKSAPYEFVEESSGEDVEYSLWLRTENVKERLNVELKIEFVDGSNNFLTEFGQKVQTGLLADKGFDMVVQYSGYGMMGAMAGYYYDLNQCDYLDFEKPWWPQKLRECITISDSVYFVSGDISVCRTTGLFALLTNNNMLADYDIGDEPYLLAAAGNWTLDRMMEMSKSVYTQLDPNDPKSDGNEYGFVFINNVSTDAFLEGSGIRMVSRNSDGNLVVDSSFTGEKADSLVNRLSAFIYQNDGVHISTKYGAIFPEGHAMFMVGKIDTLMYYMDNARKFSYGVLPIPKYDKNQVDYRTTVNFNYSMFSITKNADKPNEVAAVIEALASEGYRTVSPAVFNKAFQIRYSENPTIAAMFDIIRNSTSFDIGRLSSHTFEEAKVKSMVFAFRETVLGNAGGWKTVVARFGTKWANELEIISRAYANGGKAE